MPAPEDRPGIRRVSCVRRSPEGDAAGDDRVVVEEPLELRVGGIPVATLMRTPGSDRHLAAGFYLSEGWVSSPGEVGAIQLCGGAAGEGPAGSIENVADLISAEGVTLRSPVSSTRTVLSSCGVCGKRTIEEALRLPPPADGGGSLAAGASPARFAAQVIRRMPALLREGQHIFSATGALHAAGLFGEGGGLLALEEDVGRHNAVDKVIGRAFLEGKVPLSRAALQVSGRVSFEIVQKAYRAGIPLIAAVSGVSSLGIELAERIGITLAGFVRGDSFTVYTHPGRILALPPSRG